MSHLYRQLPPVDALCAGPLAGFPRGVALAAARQVLEEARAEIASGVTVLPDLDKLALARARLLSEGRIRPVINATGVVVHTNLGRSAWGPEARAAAARAMGYCNVEMDLPSGRRGGRLEAIDRLLAALVGCEAALVVNNCAAAVLLALTAVARDREVVVSRGELVEIGGSFRVPEVIASGGARLVEVGTTNRTRAADYRAALTEHTGALLTVHPSNFRQIGFVERPSREALVSVGAEAGVPVLEDLGSGALEDGFGETGVRTAVEAGMDLVLFSGDKLLGGPQAGVIVGKARWVERLRKHPLYRALRVDKVTLAALEATLATHLAGGAVPTPARLGADVTERTARFSQRLREASVPHRVVPSEGRAGGGALPERALPSVAVRFDGWADAEARALRVGEPSVVARVSQDGLVCDLRCVDVDDEDALLARLVEVCGRAGS
ncbi:MAG: L-seryl-tRNA(Sec) selenium transferase, partial [Myxococcales bacterium]|nr:L-seryl-tRNA(Sec) selenium transferase [Myxococcales bacterium]